jgi:hypothetical protein
VGLENGNSLEDSMKIKERSFELVIQSAIGNIVIRFAIINDVDRIMGSIKEHWDSEHILALNRDFFLYMFGTEDEYINMVIAEVENSHEIAGFLGYIKYSSNEPYDISPVLWKSIRPRVDLLGIEMFFFLIKHTNYHVAISIGINQKTTLPIFRRLGYFTGKLNHYYRIADLKKYKIAKITDKKIPPVNESKFNILLFNDFYQFKEKIDMNALNINHPYKDLYYFRHRFFDHPIYHYMVYGVLPEHGGKISAFFICREIEKFEAKILRIVDYIGNEEYFAGISMTLENIIYKNNYEYIDCYCTGMSEATMQQAGFINRNDDDENIIPNYFEPFLCKNGDIYYWSNALKDVRLFKADADQDQPRLNNQ